MRTLPLVAAVVAVLVGGCSSGPQLPDDRARVICLTLSMGGTYETVAGIAAEAGITGPDEQKMAIVAAVRDRCSRYLPVVG